MNLHDSWQRRSAAALRAGLADTDLDVPSLWLAYIGLGGIMTSSELEEAMLRERELTRHDHDVIAQALNDHSLAHGGDHPVPYAEDLQHD